MCSLQRISAAKTEHECYAEVSKLLVALFDVSRCTITLLTDDRKHMSVLQMALIEVHMNYVTHMNESCHTYE